MPSLLRFAGHCVLLLTLVATAAPTAPLTVAPARHARLASLPPQVRLLKLHLVRPDLIPYPIAYEVCC
jgi:hypothetical protein